MVPATNNWLGTDNNGSWTDGGNWSLGKPTAGQTLVFGLSGTGTRNLTDDIANLTIDAISFQDTGYTITATTSTTTANLVTFSGALATVLSDTVGGNLINGKVTASGTISASTLSFAMLGTSDVQMNITAGTDTINPAISGTLGLVKAGSGTLVLSGASNYSGVTTIAAGTLRLGAAVISGNSGPLGTTAAGTIVNSGATFDFGGFKMAPAGPGSVESLTFSGTGFGGQGASCWKAPARCSFRTTGHLDPPRQRDDCRQQRRRNFTFSGALGGAGFNLTLDGTATGTFSGLVSIGSGSITKTGTGSWLLGNSASSYTGGTTIVAGTLKPSVQGIVPNGPFGTTAVGIVVGSGGVLDLNGLNLTNAYPLTLNGTGISGGALINSSSGAVTYLGPITLGTTASSILASLGNLSLAGNINNNGFDLTLIGSSTSTSNGILVGARQQHHRGRQL